MAPLCCKYIEAMVDKKDFEQAVKQYIADFTDQEQQYQAVEIEVTPSNDVRITIDAVVPIDIDFCVNLSRYIEQHIDRETEDYALEVSSVGLTDPFKTPFQYKKNIGNEVIVLPKEGKKMRGILVDATETGFSIDAQVQVEVENKKRKQTQTQTFTWHYADVKSVCYDLKV